jgi:hypothetical protein
MVERERKKKILSSQGRTPPSPRGLKGGQKKSITKEIHDKNKNKKQATQPPPTNSATAGE